MHLFGGLTVPSVMIYGIECKGLYFCNAAVVILPRLFFQQILLLGLYILTKKDIIAA